MSLEAQIEELRAELKASSDAKEKRQIARELEALTAQYAALAEEN